MLTDAKTDSLTKPGGDHFTLPRVPSWTRDFLVLVFLVGGSVLLHLAIPGQVPSGADGGNWLAMARERLGSSAMAGDATYAPVFPTLLAGLLSIIEPIPAIVTAGLFTKAALLISVYWCGRSMGRFHGAVGALLVGVTGAHLEAYAWGAYPQTLASAFGLISVLAVVRYLKTRQKRQLALGVVMAAATLTTHLLVGGLLLFAIPIALAHALWVMKADRASWVRAGVVAVLIAVPGGLYAYQAVVVAGNNGYRPPLNPLGLGIWFSVMREIREAPLLWAMIALFSVVGVVAAHRSQAELATKALGLSWIVVGAIFFGVTGEARSLLMTQVGLVLLGVFGFRHLWLAARRRARRESRPRLAGAVWRALAVIGVGLSFGLVVGGVVSYRDTTGWFRVVDDRELAALDALKAVAGEGDLVVASAGNNGHPIGWWVQGYAGIPTLSGIDLRWLAFPLEREQAELANTVFSGDLSVLETADLLDSVGADFLVIDRRNPDGDWMSTSLSRAFPVIYESPTLVVTSAIPIEVTPAYGPPQH